MTKKLFQVELADALQRIGIGIAFLFAFGLSAAEATSVTRDGLVNLGKSVVMNLRQESCAIIESC